MYSQGKGLSLWISTHLGVHSESSLLAELMIVVKSSDRVCPVDLGTMTDDSVR
jgi:hypothetical protein